MTLITYLTLNYLEYDCLYTRIDYVSTEMCLRPTNMYIVLSFRMSIAHLVILFVMCGQGMAYA